MYQPSTPSGKQVPLQPMRVPQRNCFKSGQPGYFARECPTKELARKPRNPAAQDDQVKYCEETLASDCTGPIFCVHCGMTKHSASQGQNTAKQEDLASGLNSHKPLTRRVTMKRSECCDQQKLPTLRRL